MDNNTKTAQDVDTSIQNNNSQITEDNNLQKQENNNSQIAEDNDLQTKYEGLLQYVPRTFQFHDMIAGIGILLLGYFFIKFTMFSIIDYHGWAENYYVDYLRIGTGLGLTLFTFGYVTIAEWYARKKKITLTNTSPVESFAWLTLLLLQAAAYLIVPRSSWTFFFLAGLFVTAVYWTIVRFGAISNELTSDYVLHDFFSALLLSLPCHFFDRDRAIFCSLRSRKKNNPVGQIVIGILCAAPVLTIAYALLCQVDNRFGSLISFERIFRRLGDGMIEFLATLFFGYFVANYIFALFYKAYEKSQKVKKKSTIVECCGQYGILSMTSVATICILVLCLYGFFFAVQAKYLFLAFANQLPKDFTYAEYARQGFFELCKICILNLSLLLACHLFVKQPNKKLMRGLHLGIYSCSIMFLAIAFRKMVLYITTYGLTHKRILTCWFMILIAAIIIIGIVREFMIFPMLRYISFFAAFWFTALSFANVDALIVKNQMYLYRNNKIEALDYDLLDECQLSALPYIDAQIQAETDPDVVQSLAKVADNIRSQYRMETDWWMYTIARKNLK